MSYRSGSVTTSPVASKQPEVTQEDISPRSDQAFRFLDLPAELRNMVYAHCEEAPPDFQWYHHWQTQLESCIQGNTSSYGAAHGLKYFNLTRASRQIRAEYMSLYLSRNYKWVDLESATSYFAAFHANERVADHVAINLYGILPTRVRFDLLPVFRHLAAYPRVECDFDVTNRFRAQLKEEHSNLVPIMSRVAARSGAVEFKAALDHVVSVTPNSKVKTVMVVLTAACKLKTQQRKDFETAFRTALDLQDMAPWRVLIKYERV